MPDLGLPSPAELPAETGIGERPSERKAMIRNVVTAAILGVAIAGLAWTFGQPGDAETSQAVSLAAKATGPAPRVGELAPDFQVYQLDGTSVHLSDFRGRAVWLNFWATWCPPCRQESPEIEAAYQKYRHAGVVILAIDMGEDPRTIYNYVQRAGLSYTIGVDQGTDIAAMYRVAGLPNHFFYRCRWHPARMADGATGTGQDRQEHRGNPPGQRRPGSGRT